MAITVKELCEKLSKVIEQGKGDYEVYCDNYPDFLVTVYGEVGVNDEEKEVII